MKPKLNLLVFFLLLPFCAFAQKEANIWYLGDNLALDFNAQPPILRQDGPVAPGWGTVATHSDSEGNLLLYSDGLKVWNGNSLTIGQLQELEHYSGIVEVVPYPGKENVFYIFYKGPDPSSANNYWAIFYALVDLDANNGRGSILTKHQLLHTDGHGSFTITYNPDRNLYWLLTDRNDNVTDVGTDRIYAYKIDTNGINTEPVISSPLYIGHAGDYRLSPRGDKLAFSIGHHTSLGYADFNLETGEVFNMVSIDGQTYLLEFSPNANVLYGVRDSSVYQFSLCSDDKPTMYWTKKKISSKGPELGRPQLGPDGKIYIPQIGTENYAVIHQPDRLGLACDLRLADLPIGKQVRYLLPHFPTNYLYKPNTVSMPVAEAGEDKVVCVGESVRLGTSNDSNLTYHWSPGRYLDDTLAAMPVFRYPSESITCIRKFQLILSVWGEHCSMIDTVEVTVQPLPEQPGISGSRSVCPGVEEVTYETEAKAGLNYQWSVSGGTVVEGNGTPSIKVNWGATNPDAKVELSVFNSYGCARSITLPVRVNVLLQTETPMGDTAVCINDNVQVYQVNHTNGSEYSWESSGGEINDGQGTNIATVQWSGEGLHHVLVREKSSTRDTVCFGTSEQLQVRVFRDTAAIGMQVVTINEQHKQDVDLRWEYSNVPRLASSLQLQRREGGAGDWTTVKEVPVSDSKFKDPNLPIQEKYYEYRIQGQNKCGELIQSTIHNSILLKGGMDQQAEEISLQWNRYEGWDQGVKEYQIWRQLDEDTSYQLLHSTTSMGNLLRYQANIGRDGFVHRFRIKAVAEGAELSSWSNEIVLEFEHPLSIPNVFTPNGDGYNDFFFIPKLEMYPNNELVIFNRWGQEVYRRRGFQGEWNGGGLPLGTYYYLLSLARANQRLKGWVQIIY